MSLTAIAKSTLKMLSGQRLLRALFPILRLHFHRNDSQECRIKYGQKLHQLQRFFFWRFAPLKYRGGLALNLIGYQFLRYFYFNFKFRLRAHVRSNTLPERFLRDIYNDGYVAWPDALSPADQHLMLEFFETHQADHVGHFEDFAELVIANSKGPAKGTEDYKKIYDFIKRASRWDEIGPVLTRKNFTISPYVAILHYKSCINNSAQQDGQDIPHTDVFYPSFKAFFYLSDVEVGNGPLTYYRGSHAFGISRALQEYRDSIRYFSGGNNDVKPISSLDYVERCGFPSNPIIGAKGLGILFNVQGVHRRGEFLKDKDRERKVLLIDFRQVEASSQRFAA